MVTDTVMKEFEESIRCLLFFGYNFLFDETHNWGNIINYSFSFVIQCNEISWNSIPTQHITKQRKILFSRHSVLSCYAIDNIMTTTTPTNTAISIKSFRFLRTYYRTTGIYSFRQNQNRAINKKVAFICLYFVQFLMTTIAFLLFKAESIGDLAFAYLMSLTVIFYLVYIIAHTWKIPQILNLIEQYDEFIRESELNECFCPLISSQSQIKCTVIVYSEKSSQDYRICKQLSYTITSSWMRKLRNLRRWPIF